MDPQRLIPGDASLIENIVNYLKAKGIFDEFRHECLADVDTKSSCQNLSQRVDGYTSKFLALETWHSDLNKNELRNKLRRNLDGSDMLALGADCVVEQVINPKIHQLFLPKIIEVVHKYIMEQNELLIKRPETSSSDSASYSEKSVHDTSDNKVKTSISDPIADILSFSYSKPKPTPTTSTHGKSDNIQQKHVDIPKLEKKKEEKTIPVIEKSTPEIPAENATATTIVSESKIQTDKEKEKVKKEHEISQEISKKAMKEELKPEKKKTEEVKMQSTDTVSIAEKSKQKLKSGSTQKSSNSNETKKSRKEILEKTLEKSKPTKSLKESTSPTKNVPSLKSVSKGEKIGESSKSKSSEPVSSKTSESSKKLSKSSSIKKDSIPKQKGQNDRTDKSEIPKSSDKNDQNISSDSTDEKIDKSKIPKSSDKNDQDTHCDSSSEKNDKSKILKLTDKSDPNTQYDSSNSEKVAKPFHYSSSYDSSQGSDQEKSSSSSSKKEKQKHFYKHARKEKSKEHSDKKNISDKKRPSDSDESPSKKPKSEKSSKLEKLKDSAVIEAAKINSRSNSFGSTSSVSSSSNTSKDNLISNSDETSESSVKGKTKKQINEKDSCQSPTKGLPPPPPPPPSSSSVLCESTSAEMSSMEDTQSSATSESSGSEAMSEESSSDSELESNNLSNTLNESTLNSSTDNMNDFYDIFLYSSSSSEFEGFQNSPEKEKKVYTLEYDSDDSDVSVSSVHTSDLSSFDDELSDVDCSLISGSNLTGKRRLTLKEAQELLQNRAALLKKKKNSPIEKKPDSVPVSFNDRSMQKSSTLVSSDEESSPSEPKRSLRRERKLNPRYASSEYTSIFNSRKETFITKQSSPSVRSNSSLNSDSKFGRKDSLSEKSKLSKRTTTLEAEINAVHQAEQLQKNESNLQNSESHEEKVLLNDSSGMSSADEMDSIMNTEVIQENDKITDNSDNNRLKNHLKLKPQNSSKMNINSCSLKRKLPASETAPVKRPCSRSSVDSSSSEFAPNENKPFNSEKQNIVEDKILRDSSLKGSDLTDGIKKDPFCKQRTNNNGDILGQKDIFPKNSHGKTISVPEKKANESDASKELNAL